MVPTGKRLNYHLPLDCREFLETFKTDYGVSKDKAIAAAIRLFAMSPQYLRSAATDNDPRRMKAIMKAIEDDFGAAASSSLERDAEGVESKPPARRRTKGGKSR